ncbi:hypothetical protein QF019_003111 [Pseudomonas frederiksbergensis]|jgi:hypothetical protein|uniref:hypothetical protein n=1 Tax=Pseudomonas frederiksbergensis TaxID=104087 RepID=UPI003D1EFA21
MTFIAMVSMENCVVLGADRETFSIYTSGLSKRSGDAARKITKTADGFITASGLVELIDPVKNRFRSESPKDIEHMLDIIEQEQQRLSQRDSLFARDWIAKTTWKLSLPMSRGVTAAFYDATAHQLRAIEPGLAMITYPGEVAVHEQTYVNGLFPQGLFLDPCENAIANVIDQVLGAVSFLRECGRPVSREIDFAIHWGDKRNQIERMAT